MKNGRLTDVKSI